MTDKSPHSDKQPPHQQRPDTGQQATGPENTPSAAAGAGQTAAPKKGAANGQSSKPEQPAKGRKHAAEKSQSAGATTVVPPATAPAGKPKRGGAWFTAFLVLVLIGAVAALGYYGWRQQQQLQASMARLDQALQGQVEEISSLSGSVDRVRTEAERALQKSAETSQQQSRQLQNQVQQELQQQSRQFEQQLRGLRDRVRAISTTTTDDWKLAEAYYLTRLASQRLLMERDTGSALALLQTADKIVRNYPDPDLYPVRSALAENIASLKLANNVDREGLYLQIAALGRKLDELRVSEDLNFEPEPQAPAAGPATAEGGATGIWQSVRQSFQRALGKLSDFIRISHTDETVRPLMAPEQKLYLRSSLQLTLDTAQLALMREQPEVYGASLDKAGKLVRELYADSEARERILAELQNLQNTDIIQALPDISESQETLGDYLDQRHRVAPEGSGQAPPQGQPQGAQQ